jgi:hypothetical protein
MPDRPHPLTTSGQGSPTKSPLLFGRRGDLGVRGRQGPQPNMIVKIRQNSGQRVGVERLI